MDLLALADFTLVARHGGFGRASRAAGRPKASLSRRVAALEASLHLRLFERGRTLTLTEEGRALHERAGHLLAELEEAAAAIASGGATPRGRLRISAPLLFSQLAMGKLAADLALRFPDIRIEVTTEDRPVDMIEEGYDLVIRVNPAPDETLIGRAFLRDRVVMVAVPELDRPPYGEAVPALVRIMADRQVWTARPGMGESIVVEPVLALSSLVMIRDAVLSGVGVARLPLSLVMHDIAAGRLVSWGEADLPETMLWALYPSRRLLSTRVSAFLEQLKQAFPTGSPEELAAYVGV